MSERRWKVIKNDVGSVRLGEILTLKRDDGTDLPFFFHEGGKGSTPYHTKRLVEIDANGKTIRTYKDGDTLDGGTLVKEEAMEGLDVVSMEIPMRCHKNDGCIGCPLRAVHCRESLAAEVQRLRDKLEKIDDVWRGAPENATASVVNWYDNATRCVGISKAYTRDPPKTSTRLAAERLWEKIKLSDTDAVDAIAEAMEGLRGSTK